jgi:hypothetical protein
MRLHLSKLIENAADAITHLDGEEMAVRANVVALIRSQPASRTSCGIEPAPHFRIAIRCCRSALSRWMGLSAELRLSESLEKFSVAVVAMDDGRFAYQVYLVCGEPRTLLTDSARYLTPDDAAQAGYEAVASMSETPVRRPYAPSSPRRHIPSLLPSG